MKYFFLYFQSMLLFITYRNSLKTTSSCNNIHLSAIIIENRKLQSKHSKRRFYLILKYGWVEVLVDNLKIVIQ